MKKYFGCIYHFLVLIHHIYVMNYTSELELSKSTDQRISDIETFALRYFTSWNMMVQTLFLLFALTADLLHLLPKDFQKYENTILKLKGYIFTSFVFPCALFVSGMFWGIYTINREWVLPAVVDAFLPEWVNHSMHTFILIPVIMEILITNHLLPSFKAAFYGLSVFIFIYDILFFFTYYEHGRWLYGLFYVFTWEGRIIFMIFNYLAVVCIMKLGIYIQHFKEKYQVGLFQNCLKSTKQL